MSDTHGATARPAKPGSSLRPPPYTPEQEMLLDALAQALLDLALARRRRQAEQVAVPSPPAEEEA